MASKFFGLAAFGAVLLVGACADEPEVAVVTDTEPAVVCTPEAGYYGRVVEVRPVYYTGTYEAGYSASTDVTLIADGTPNANGYVLVREDNTRAPIITRDVYRVGDTLYVENDSCARARVNVIQELG